MLGNVVFEKFIDEDVINLSNLYPGFYLIKINDKDSTKIERILKQ